MIKIVQHGLQTVGAVYKADEFTIEEAVDTLLSNKFSNKDQLLIPDPRNKTASGPINYKMQRVKDGQAMKSYCNTSYISLKDTCLEGESEDRRITHGICGEDSSSATHFTNRYNIRRAAQR